MPRPRLFWTTGHRVLTSLILLATLGALFGCGSTRAVSLQPAISAYEAGRYQSAYDQARKARLEATGTQKSESAYVAGLSAMKLNRPVTARSLLEEATSSSDKRVAGRANVSLGTLLLEDGDPLSAAQAYDRAADLLSGSDAARARHRAGLAYEAAGATEAARLRLADTDDLESITPGRFTIQGGFYTDRLRAVTRAQQLSSIGRNWSIGPAQVVPTTVRGTSGYAVQIGDFSNRTDAEMTRRQLGDEKTFVTKVARL
ncbi:MAG: hypothetical protein CBC35_05820 [Planctomycetes bacterium TMED75]|nr:hypothetical protein [Planctomycetaceae bacterium]OUU93331.1 MAG: hypothetical protein CBC35_05820 [Planctomycetes bacterium TMED75]